MARMPQHHRDLWEAYFASRSVDDRNAVVMAYSPQAERQAGKKHSQTPETVDMDSLLSAAHVGLITAVEKYDPDTGVPEVHFIARHVSFAMSDWLREVDSISRRQPDVEYPETMQLEPKAMLGHECIQEDEVSDSWSRHEGDTSYGFCVVEELSALTNQERLSLMLCYRFRFTMLQSADVMGMSTGDVSRLHNMALHKLKRAASGVEDDGDFDFPDDYDEYKNISDDWQE